MNENSFWFYYSIASPTIPVQRKGAFDFRDMDWWEGVKPLKNEPMTYRIYLRCLPTTPVILDEANFQAFARAWALFTKEEDAK
jgi:hypothetical protein